ncbi:MAG: radical SAM protein [Bacteroidetes bacterium]|nr:radical SAM protein [Bacteroidota bacterium]
MGAINLNILYRYKNGNYFVSILEDGTKIREANDDKLIADFPESLDIKITNYCDAGCSYCHEKSTIAGKHGDLDKAFDILKVLPAGTELAIGGGDPMSHPDLEKFLIKLKNNNYIANITINEKHLDRYEAILLDFENRGLIKAIGISFCNTRNR